MNHSNNQCTLNQCTLHADEHRFDSATALSVALAEHIVGALGAAIATRGRASLVVSGGRTPLQLFQRLAQSELDWQHVTIVLADERWVANDAPGSNERLVRESLLRDKAAAAQFISLKCTADSAAAGAAPVWHALQRAITLPFDWVLLGMGDDGHTASLFPASPLLMQALDTTEAPGCIAMQAPDAPHERLSLNLSALLDARQIAIHIQGTNKWSVYQSARGAGEVSTMPIRAVLGQTDVPVAVYWSP